MGKDDKKRVRKAGVAKEKSGLGLKKYGCLITLLILVLLISAPFTLWYLLPESKWRVRVVDMTAPFPNYREHESLFWVFNNMKVRPRGKNKVWTNNEDYVGYYPELSNYDEGKFTYRRISEADLANIDMLYIVDSYGVYVDDYKKPEELMIAHMDYSKLIFGGFTETEAILIEEFIRRGKALVGEFNTFASPTHGNTRRRMEWIFGARWTGWAGRFFVELSDKTDVPVWARRHWRWHYGEEWRHKGPGWLLTHEDTRLFVMKEGPDAYPMALRIKDLKEKEPLLKGCLDEVPYYFWFDIVEADEHSEILAKYHFHLKESGINLMRKFKLPLIFPTVVRSSRDPLRLYLAGDFSDHKAMRGSYKIFGLPWYKKVGRFSEHYRDQTAFFWQFYVPFLQNIMNSPLPAARSGNLRDGFVPMPSDAGGDATPDAGVAPAEPKTAAP